MKDKSKLLIIGLVALTLIVVILSFVFNRNNDNKGENKINIVTNYSNFYTVNSCLYRLITHVTSKDSESLILLLNDNYKKENNITKDSVLGLFSNIDTDSTFVSRKMYYEKINQNITKYYVKGYVEKNQLFDFEEIVQTNKTDMYFIVYLDSLNKTFSIELYDGKIFLEGDLDEK